MKSKKVVLLVLATVMMLGLAVAAVVTSLKLQEISTAPVAPNVPVSQPRAQEVPRCRVSFVVPQQTAPVLVCTEKEAFKTSITTANQLEDGDEVARGDTIVYRVGYRNTGTAAGTIAINDTLSDKLEFVSADAPCSLDDGVVVCSDISVAAGASGSATITARVVTGATAGEIENSAVVTPSVGEQSTCEIALTIPANSAVACTNKDAYKTSVTTNNKLDDGDEVARGDVIVYQIGYENSGDAAGTITIVDQLSDKLEFVRADEPCEHQASNRTVRCENIAVAAGGTGNKKITVRVLAAATAGEFNNTARVIPSAGEESTCPIDLELKVSSSPTPTPTPPPVSKAPVCNDYCANDGECPSGLKCSWNKCRNPECLDDTDCSCENPPGCNEVCNPDNQDNECVGGYICDRTTKTCRNSACTGESDCTCEVKPNKTAPPQQTLPTAGSPVPGFLFLAAGAVLLVLGVLVVGL